MNCAEFKDQVTGYVLGALSPEEHFSCHDHLQSAIEHDGCFEAMAKATDICALIGESLDPVKPGSDVWPKIVARIGAHAVPLPARKRRGREVVLLVLAAAAILLAFLLGRDRDQLAEQNARQGQKLAQLKQESDLRERCERQLAQLKDDVRSQREAVALLREKKTQVVPLAPKEAVAPSGVVANVILNAEKKKAYVLTSGFVPIADKDYQLWLMRDGKPIAAGLFKPDQQGAALLALEGSLFDAGIPDALAVSIEATGGSPDTPHGDIIMVGATKVL